MEVFMAKLFIKFSLDLCAYDEENEGAIFHRWLPDGKKDPIILKVKYPNTKLKVWFERCGFIDDAFIRFSSNRREIEPSIMDKQGCLYSGPLFGLLEIEKIPNDTAIAIKESRKGDAKYIKFTKTIVKNVLYEPLSSFIEILRVKMGQYWLRQMPKYDSRIQSIGYYSGSVLRMKWRFARGRKWNVLDPDGPDTSKAIFRAGPQPDYKQYMNKNDWESIKQIDCKEKSSDIFLLRSHRLCEEGDIRLAFIEGITALELSIHDFIRERALKKILMESVESFYNIPLRTQLTVLCSAIGKIPEQQIEMSIKAIKIRNKIVHDGFLPKNENKAELYALLKIVSTLANNGVCKFPSNQYHSTSMPAQNWLKTYQKDA
jgi:hypothetical protein